MTVYVDDGRYAFRNLVMGHMVADTEEELHEMAERLGLRRTWYQAPPKASWPHYDVSLSKRREAERLGAVAITQRELILKIRSWREEVQGGE